MCRIHLGQNQITFPSKVPQEPLTIRKAFLGRESQCLLSPEAGEWEGSLLVCGITLAFKKLPSVSFSLPLSLSPFSSHPPLCLFLLSFSCFVHQRDSSDESGWLAIS